MEGGHLLAMGRVLALVAMMFALVGIALTFSSYATSEFSIDNADVSTRTRGFCSPKGEMLHCEDKLVIDSNGAQIIVENSPITGNAFIETETF